MMPSLNNALLLHSEDGFHIVDSLRKQPMFYEVATCALAKRRLSNERRNSVRMTVVARGIFLSTNQKHFQDLGSAHHQCGISALATQTSFWEGSSGNLATRLHCWNINNNNRPFQDYSVHSLRWSCKICFNCKHLIWCLGRICIIYFMSCVVMSKMSECIMSKMSMHIVYQNTE